MVGVLYVNGRLLKNKDLFELDKLKREILLHELKIAFVINKMLPLYITVYDYFIRKENEYKLDCRCEHSSKLGKLIRIHRSSKRNMYKRKTTLAEYGFVCDDRRLSGDTRLYNISSLKYNKHEMLNDLANIYRSDSNER